MTILWMLPLLLGTADSPGPPAPTALEETEGKLSYATLVSEYDTAVDTWKAAVKAEEDRKARRALRKLKPAIEFYPRFKTLADSGEGRALVWMMDHFRDAGNKRKDAPEVMIDASAKLIKNHRNAEWFDEAMDAIYKQKRELGVPRLEALSLEVVETCESKVMQAKTLSRLAGLFERSKDEDEKAKADVYYERLEKDYDEAVLSQALSGERFSKLFLREGKLAPDFDAETAAGEKFKLSDYRGKVTLIDFWGFW